MSTSHFRFFRVPEPSLNVLTVITLICLFRRKVTKSTICYLFMRAKQCIRCSAEIWSYVLNFTHERLGKMCNLREMNYDEKRI